MAREHTEAKAHATGIEAGKGVGHGDGKRERNRRRRECHDQAVQEPGGKGIGGEDLDVIVDPGRRPLRRDLIGIQLVGEAYSQHPKKWQQDKCGECDQDEMGQGDGC